MKDDLQRNFMTKYW